MKGSSEVSWIGLRFAFVWVHFDRIHLTTKSEISQSFLCEVQ